MKIKIRVFSLLLVSLLVFLPAQAVSAKGSTFDGQVIFGQSYTLKSGESLDGDLLVFGGSAEVENGASVHGNVVLFGGNLNVDGEVEGDVVVTGGSITLASSAHVFGSLVTIGGTLEQADGAQVDGEISNSQNFWIGDGSNGKPLPGIPETPAVPLVPKINFNFDPFRSLLNAFGQAISLAILAMLVMLFLAPHADRVAHAVFAQPLTAGGLGLLTVLVAPIGVILLSVTIVLIPVAVAAALALAVAAVFGWIAIGYEIGQRFTAAIHQNWHPAFSAGLGVFALTLVGQALTGIPVLNCVGWLVPFLLSLAGLGAVFMSRFGTQNVVAAAAAGESTVPAISSTLPVESNVSGIQEPEAWVTPQRKPRQKKE